MPGGHLCTIELIADGHAERCLGESCAFWQDGCVLEAVEADLQSSPRVAALLLDLRREIEAGESVPVELARERLRGALSESDDEVGPAGGATELV
jgi:hypothetical protein